MVSGPWHWLRVLVSPGLSNYLILPFWSAIILSLHKCLLLAYWKFWDEPMHVWCVNHLWRETINLNWVSTSLFVILSKELHSIWLNIANLLNQTYYQPKISLFRIQDKKGYFCFIATWTSAKLLLKHAIKHAYTQHTGHYILTLGLHTNIDFNFPLFA